MPLRTGLWMTFCLVLILGVLAAPDSLVAEEVDAARAVKIANDYLSEQGWKGVGSIQAIQLTTTSLINGKPFWDVRWNRSLGPKEKPYIGLRIYLDGELAAIVKSKSTSKLPSSAVRPGAAE
jgi:hypothetical protein